MDPQLGDYSFLTAIARGWGLAIRCTACRQERRWTDEALAERFGHLLDCEVAALRPRLVCSCGGREASLYFYQAGVRDTGPLTLGGIAAREAALRSQSTSVQSTSGTR